MEFERLLVKKRPWAEDAAGTVQGLESVLKVEGIRRARMGGEVEEL